ncbi:MAG: hypothetical protein GF349_02860 [Candidatus Magasanikbacteria bacterium]|nr:hypothetical protein [Candidatus Magasanikbacteria bacterium]
MAEKTTYFDRLEWPDDPEETRAIREQHEKLQDWLWEGDGAAQIDAWRKVTSEDNN